MVSLIADPGVEDAVKDVGNQIEQHDQDRGDEGDFRTLDELVQAADVLTFHTPLYKEGPYKTLHLADETLISRLKPGAILINACRGPVVDNAALLRRLQDNQALSVVLDVWEPEPDLNTELLKRVDIGTAHIAGYTLEGKARGTTQVFEAYSAFIGHHCFLKACLLSNMLQIADAQ